MELIKLNNTNLTIIEKNNKVIIANLINGHWVKLSKQCFDIILDAEANKKTCLELINEYEDLSDKEYLQRLLDYLKKYMFLQTTEYIYPKIQRDFNLCITHRCNLSCAHCSVSAGTLKDSEYLDASKMFFMVDQLLKFNPKLITITGGEPLVREDFFDIVNYIKSNSDCSLTLMTNGTLVTEKNAPKLVELFYGIDISLDGVDEETCEKVRGKGVFNKVINGVEILKNNGFKNISLSMVDSKYNHEKREQFIKLNEKFGTLPLIRKLAPTGRASEAYEELFYENKSVKSETVVSAISGTATGVYAINCHAITKKLHIESNGDFYPCGGLALPEFKLGNIFEVEELFDYINEEKYKTSIGYLNYKGALPHNSHTCKDCKVNVFCISCPVYAYSYNKLGMLEKMCHKDALEKWYLGE